MNTRKYSRTMAEAFGPYTSQQLEPMPDNDDVLQIISAAAMGQDVQERAKELIKRMADTWADRNLDEVLA